MKRENVSRSLKKIAVFSDDLSYITEVNKLSSEENESNKISYWNAI